MALLYALFEEAGKFLAGRVLSETPTGLQAELASGKRVKVKASHVMLRFDQPSPSELLGHAAQTAESIDLDLAWEFAPEGEFGFQELARDYFGSEVSQVQQAAALLRLHESPHYFRRAGKGLFRKAPQETVQAALAAIERKRAQAEQAQRWAEELGRGQCPAPIREHLFRLLFRPDKNSTEYKALVQATRQTQTPALALLQRCGALENEYQFHWQRFVFEHFPGGTDFASGPACDDSTLQALPVASVQAFSIDDSHTTEIDDALSVQGLGSGQVTLGIHIAAPSLALTPDSHWDRVARQRLSTVYMPGWKLTMLPHELVQAFTLKEGHACPAVSLYLVLDESSLEIREQTTRLERVPIAANLRHDVLDERISEDSLSGTAPADYPFARELAFAFRLAQHLKASREQVRGRPETFTRADFTFRLDNGQSPPNGHERVQIEPRRRGAPLDLIVSEAMILANSRWGGWLAECGVPGIYRSQSSLAPGIKVRMGTRALPHAGIGVAQYAWATSPLRRYVDLVNQWQLLACIRHGTTAALAAPFKAKDAALMAIVSNFETTYAAYNAYQNSIEQYWTLRWIEQNQVQELEATVLRETLVRATALPLVLNATGVHTLPRGTRVRVRITGWDLITLQAHAQLIEHFSDTTAADEAGDTEGDDLPGPSTWTLDIDTDSDGVGVTPESLASSVAPAAGAAGAAD